MKTLAAVLLGLFVTGCGQQQRELVFVLDTCGKLKAIGNFALEILIDDINQLQVIGSAADTAGFAWSHDGQALLLEAVKSDALKVQLNCVSLSEIELLGSVQAKQSPAGFAQYDRIAVYGESVFSAVQVNAEKLDLRTSGLGALRLDQIVADSVQVLASGQSQQYLSGEAQEMNVALTGNARIFAANLTTQRVQLSTRGASTAEVFPTAHIGGSINDTSQIGYVSNPVLQVSLQVSEEAVVKLR